MLHLRPRRTQFRTVLARPAIHKKAQYHNLQNTRLCTTGYPQKQAQLLLGWQAY